MIIRPSPTRQIVNNNINNTQNKNAEPQTPPVVKDEPKIQKAQETSRVKRNNQENRKGNKKPIIENNKIPTVENNKKSAFEILMEED